MNLWAKHPLAQKHQIALLDARQAPYWLAQNGEPVRDKLPRRIAEINVGEKPPFPPSDIARSRVGAKAMNLREAVTDSARIDIFPISWAEYTTMRDPAFRETLTPEERFHCLSIGVNAETSDGKLILTTRSNKVSIYVGMLHVASAGFLDLELIQSTQTAHMQVFRELEEELGVLPSEIFRLEQLGLVQHLVANSATVEICFTAKLGLTAHEVIERSKTAKDSWEGKAGAYSKDEVVQMIGLDSDKKFNPSGAGALMMFLGL
jgi:hypothetical protein